MFLTFQKLFRYLLPIIILSLSSTVFSQTAKSSFKVLGISVTGNKTTDANTIIASSGIKVNDEIQIPGDATLNAIRNLYSLNIFNDIQIINDREIGSGIFLIIKVVEFPRIEKVVIEGNDELDTDDIEAKINFIRGQILKPQEVVNIKQRILKLYEEEGYLNAKITSKNFVYFTADTSEDEIIVIWRNEKDLSEEYHSEYDKEDVTYSNLIDKIKDRVLLKLEVEENDEVIVRKIEFAGNSAFDDGDLKSEMDEIEESVWWKFWSSANFDKKKFEGDKKLITDFYLRNGYRDAEII